MKINILQFERFVKQMNLLFPQKENMSRVIFNILFYWRNNTDPIWICRIWFHKLLIRG
jgi:hypothetical protein